jgi:excisionase family DNA binding protein
MPNQDQEDARHPELLTVQEVAEHLRVSRVTVWRWCQKGTLPAFRISRHWRIPRDRMGSPPARSEARPAIVLR